MLEGYPNGKEAVLKTAERKLLQVRVLSPPFNSPGLAGIGAKIKLYNEYLDGYLIGSKRKLSIRIVTASLGEMGVPPFNNHTISLEK